MLLMDKEHGEGVGCDNESEQSPDDSLGFTCHSQGPQERR
jgi:hypothetical protein